MKKLLFTLLVLVAALLPVMAFAEAPVVLANVEMFPGNYLANGADAVSSTQPAGGYAYLSEDGKTLTLHNYDNMGKYCISPRSIMIVNAPLTVNMEGESLFDGWYQCLAYTGIVQKAALTFQGEGKLTVYASSDILWGNTEEALTFAEGTVEIGIADAGIWTIGPIQICGGNVVSTALNGSLMSDKSITISSGSLTTVYDGIAAGSITISGGKIEMESSGISTFDGGLVISGGDINIKNTKNIDYYSIACGNQNVFITGGRLNISNAKVGIRANNVHISGGDISMSYRGRAIEAEDSIQCGLPLPEGVEIRKAKDFFTNRYDVFCLDLTDHFDRENDPDYIPGLRTIHLFTALLPTTGDNANIALWAALAVMSAAAMLVIRRRRSV